MRKKQDKPSWFVDPKKKLPLTKEHYAHLQASGISDDVMRERGYETIGFKSKLKELGFSPAQQRCEGILMPLHGVTGEVVGHQYKPDHPRVDRQRDRNIKYENPTGASIRLDVPPRCLAQLGDPKVPLVITEGIKKVDALASRGICAIGLTGVWGFKGRNAMGGTTILADWDSITLKGRKVYTGYDSDTNTNPAVLMAERRLAEHLKRKGADAVFRDLLFC